MASERPPPAALVPGAEIDGWLLEEALCTGGSAHLWRVKARAGGADALPLLMKVPRVPGAADPTAGVGFEVEQIILPVLRGPHVPRFVARGDAARQPYIVMEHVSGTTLQRRLEAAPLAADEIAEIGWRVATALHDLHRQCVVHLDLHPGHVLLRPEGTAVLVDFGRARHDRLPDLLDGEPLWPHPARPAGSTACVTPEHLRGVRDDPRSDLFALGAMLYRAATGSAPFEAPTTARGLRRRMHAGPVPPCALRTDCPPWLQEVILKCLALRPEQRWQSAAQLALALREAARPQVQEPARSVRPRRSAAWEGWRRWIGPFGAERQRSAPTGCAGQLNRSPIILAAVDTGHTAALLELLRATVQRVVIAESAARLVCLSVVMPPCSARDTADGGGGQSQRRRQLVGLRHWGRPIGGALGPDGGRLSFHVLEAADAAAAIVEFARSNLVDHIVIGACGHAAPGCDLGRVSSQVLARAQCTVTVVRG
jgi:protein-serine/threonine kinase